MNVALRPDSINIVSLCTGGGGLDLGLELAMPGARSVVLVEREAFAVSELVSAIQQGLMAEAAIWSDVTTFDGRPWRGIVDGVIGGIPCQPHSLAGKRQGSDDERDLWSDARRIIVQSGAWFVLIENVSGMLSAKPGLDPGALRVRRDLSRLGFDVEGGLFTASEVGASHERERVFILAVADRHNEHDYRPRIERAGRRRQSANGGPQLADASGYRQQWSAQPDCGADESGQQTSRRGDTERRDRNVVDAPGDRRREGWPKPIVRGRRNTFASADGAVGHALSGGHDGRSVVAIGRQVGRAVIEGPGECLGLFPPGPGDLSTWASVLASSPELEPAFRRVADGLASRLDVARVDRLRLLGNGVVSLEAAYAVRTLATRLAAAGSPGATRLVRMMELREMVSLTPHDGTGV